MSGCAKVPGKEVAKSPSEPTATISISKNVPGLPPKKREEESQKM
jgi:hypothetical protein